MTEAKQSEEPSIPYNATNGKYSPMTGSDHRAIKDQTDIPKKFLRRFSVHCSTETCHKSDDKNFYGPYAHIRETLDYSYHCNYKKERQWLQDAIISDMTAESMVISGDCDVNGDFCTSPTEPWLVYTAGVQGAGKRFTLRYHLLGKQHDSTGNKAKRSLSRFPLLGFVGIDPYEIRRRLPEFTLYAETNEDTALDMMRKEAGYIAEILTLSALMAGKNVVLDGDLNDATWYRDVYFKRLRKEFTNLKIALLHIVADQEDVSKWAMECAKETGRLIPIRLLEQSMQQVPKSVRILKPHVDFFCELRNSSKLPDVEIVTKGVTWDSFQMNWLQTCAYVPEKMQKQASDRFEWIKQQAGVERLEKLNEEKPIPPSTISQFDTEKKPTRFVTFFREPGRSRRSSFSILASTENNYRSNDMEFYGFYAYIRKTLDYNYHHNYNRERQLLQDAIIDHMMKSAELTDVNGDMCTTPTEPWGVFTAGGMGAGKSYTINTLKKKGRFPLLAFVSVDPDEIRRHLPEFPLYIDQCPGMAGELTRKEAGYVSEILTLAALQAGKNVLVDGSLRDSEWYKDYFERIRSEYPHLKIAILHVVAPRETVIRRAEERAKTTGRVIPRETLEAALEQVPKSVKILSKLADYFCELSNAHDAEDIVIVTEGETWESFQRQWLQTCAWVPGKHKKKSVNNLRGLTNGAASSE